MPTALPLLVLSVVLAGCQAGSGNVTTGDIYNTKVFVGCYGGASSGTVTDAEGNSEAGGSSQPVTADAGAIFARGFSSRDECHGRAKVNPTTLEEDEQDGE